jgi:hypothetical protein
MTVTDVRHWAGFCALLVCLPAAAEELNRGESLQRVSSDIEYFASDALEGRGVETKGIELAAQRVISTYEQYGLKPGMPDGSWRQPFEVALGEVVISADTAVELTGPGDAKTQLTLGGEFQPIRRGANGTATGGLTFLGYAISAPDEKFDEFAGADIAGRIVILIRREPQNFEGGAFGGLETSPNAYIDRKLELLRTAGAAGVLMVNDLSSAPTAEQDELMQPSSFGNDGSSVPFAHVKQAAVDAILKVTPLKTADGKTLSSLKDVAVHIDTTLLPVTQELTGWSARVATVFKADSVTTDNIIGVVEGEGPLANETIVIGGHYDHLGFGGYGSRTQNRTGEVHNGADDNASGTAAVLELARRIAAGPKPKRRMVFICFSGEERGLIGSKYYVDNPVFPLEQTVAMLNFDMIGNLKDNRVEVNGTGSAVEFAAIAQAADEATPIEITVVPGAFAGSDHLPFYQRGIPVMFCFTGMTPIYHTPDDDVKTLNLEGAVHVIDYSEQLLRGMDALDQRPTFVAAAPRGRRATARMPYLGLQPDLAGSGEDGIIVRSVRTGSPAEAAGIQTGDVIIKVGSQDVEGYQTLISLLASSKEGDKIPLTLKRGEQTVEVEATLAAPGSGN